MAELNPNNTIYSQVVWLGDRPIAYYNRDIRGAASTDVDYLHVDILNSPRVMTTSTKSIGWSWNPDPWGNGGGATGNLRLHFPGQFYDTGDGKDQNWLRDYDPQTGRYLESDPIGLRGGINTYAYSNNDPETFYDPTATDFFPVEIPGPVPVIIPVFTPAYPGAGQPAANIASGIQSTISRIFNPDGHCVIGSFCIPAIMNMIRPKPYAKPKNCPTGTKPIDQIPGLSSGDIHDIKDGVGAGPKDWTGIAPNGDVITGDHEGNSVNNGNYKDYLPGSDGGGP